MDDTTTTQILEPLIPRDVKQPPDNTLATYPGRRTEPLPMKGPPETAILIKTAGNALQAVSRSIAETDNLMAVTVPENTGPGDSLLVLVPGKNGDGGDGEKSVNNRINGENANTRTIQAEVPPNTYPGHVFLLRIPPEGEYYCSNDDGFSPLAVDAENIRSVLSNDSSVAQVVAGKDVEHNDLRLQAESDQDTVTTGTATTNQQQQNQLQQQQVQMANVYPQPQAQPQQFPPQQRLPVAFQQQQNGVAPSSSGGGGGGAFPTPQTQQQNVYHDQNDGGYDGTSTLPKARLLPVAPSNARMIMVRIPPGSTAGSKIHVTTEDGRIIEATVPEGDFEEFYLKVPPATSRSNSPVVPPFNIQEHIQQQQQQRPATIPTPTLPKPMAVLPYTSG